MEITGSSRVYQINLRHNSVYHLGFPYPLPLLPHHYVTMRECGIMIGWLLRLFSSFAWVVLRVWVRVLLCRSGLFPTDECLAQSAGAWQSSLWQRAVGSSGYRIVAGMYGDQARVGSSGVPRVA